MPVLIIRSFIFFKLSFCNFRLDNTLKITNTAFEEIVEAKGACDHVDKLIENVKEHDQYMTTQCERVVIKFDEDSSESDDDSSTKTCIMSSLTDTTS